MGLLLRRYRLQRGAQHGHGGDEHHHHDQPTQGVQRKGLDHQDSQENSRPATQGEPQAGAEGAGFIPQGGLER